MFEGPKIKSLNEHDVLSKLQFDCVNQKFLFITNCELSMFLFYNISVTDKFHRLFQSSKALELLFLGLKEKPHFGQYEIISNITVIVLRKENNSKTRIIKRPIFYRF